MKGQHLLIDCFECSKEKLDSKELVRDFLMETVNKIEMELLTPIQVHRAKKGEPKGVTGVAVITTSHISIHTFTDTNHLWMDVFSCQHFNKKSVVEYVKETFNPKKTITRQVIR